MRLHSRRLRDGKELVARAALLRAVARAFAIPAPGQLDGLREMFGELPGPLPWRNLELQNGVARARRALKAASEDEWSDGYLRLFSTRATVRLHETAYGDARRFAGQETELADLSGFYRAFGFRIAPVDPDLPDHIAVELEFLSLLRLKEAHARSSHNPVAAKITADAARSFLEQHLGRWVGALTEAIQDAEAPAPFLAVAGLARSLVRDECRFERARPTLLSRGVRNTPEQADTFDCPFDHASAGSA